MKNLFLLLALILSSNAFSRINLQDISFTKKNSKGTIRIGFTGEIDQYPTFDVIGDTILLKLKNANLKEPIDIRKSFSTSIKDTRIRAYYSEKKTIKVKAAFPFKMQSYKDLVALTIRKNYIELTFPKMKATASALKKLKKINKKSVAKVKVKKSDLRVSKKITKELLNEKYLNQLAKKEKKGPKKKDVVNTALAATAKEPLKKSKSSFSFMNYVGKFVAFLAVVLGLFYGVVTLMRKGFIKKGKLGFLNNTNQVTVLSQTHIAPKKSLMLIKAHNQVFLVSNTDAGIHPISEINDVAGLLKDGEKIIAGNNFDDSLKKSDKEDKKFKIKEDILESNKKSSLSDLITTKDKVKFSDQIKKKVKELKPLQ